MIRLLISACNYIARTINGVPTQNRQANDIILVNNGFSDETVAG